MSIEQAELEDIAHLARLHLDDSEKEEARKSISNILDLINQMQSVSTDNVAPLAHSFDAVQRLREDTVTEQNNREVLQALAPSTDKGLFLVPKVIE